MVFYGIDCCSVFRLTIDRPDKISDVDSRMDPQMMARDPRNTRPFHMLDDSQSVSIPQVENGGPSATETDPSSTRIDQV